MSKWVLNLSSNPLTEAQEKLLAHGPNFTISPGSPPIGEYIAVVENHAKTWPMERLMNKSRDESCFEEDTAT